MVTDESPVELRQSTPTDTQDYFTPFIQTNQTYLRLIAYYLHPKDLLPLARVSKTSQATLETLLAVPPSLKALFEGNSPLADALLFETSAHATPSPTTLLTDYQTRLLKNLNVEVNLNKFQLYIDEHFTQSEMVQFFDYLPPLVSQDLFALTKTTSLKLFTNQPLLNAFLDYLIRYAHSLKQGKLSHEEKKPKRLSQQLAEFYTLCHHAESLLTTFALCYRLQASRTSYDNSVNAVIDLLITQGWHQSINGHCLILLDVKISNLFIAPEGYLKLIILMLIDLQIKQTMRAMTDEEQKQCRLLQAFFAHFTRVDFINLINNCYKNNHVDLIEYLLCIHHLPIPRHVFPTWASKNMDMFYKAIQNDELDRLTDQEIIHILVKQNFEILEQLLFRLRSHQQNKLYVITNFRNRLNASLVCQLFACLLENIKKNANATKAYYLYHFFAEYSLSDSVTLNTLSDEAIKEIFQAAHPHWFIIPKMHPSWNPYWINVSYDNANPKEKRLWYRLLSTHDFRTRLNRQPSKLTYALALISRPATDSLLLPAQQSLLNNLTSIELNTIGETHYHKKILSLAPQTLHHEQNLPKHTQDNFLSGKKIAMVTGLVLITCAGVVISLTGAGAILGIPFTVKSIATMATVFGLSAKITAVIPIVIGTIITLLSATAAFVHLKRPSTIQPSAVIHDEPGCSSSLAQKSLMQHIIKTPSVNPNPSSLTPHPFSPAASTGRSTSLFSDSVIPPSTFPSALVGANAKQENHPPSIPSYHTKTLAR